MVRGSNPPSVFVLTPSKGKWVFTTLVYGWEGYTYSNFYSLNIDAGDNLYGFGFAEDLDCAGKLKAIYSYVFKLRRLNNGWEYSEVIGLADEWFNAYGPLAVDAQGKLCGTTGDCGKYGAGTVWVTSPY